MLARMDSKDGTAADLYQIVLDAAASLGFDVFSVVSKPKNGLQFKLKLKPSSKTTKYERISYSPFSGARRTGRLCWHAFRDFFRAAYSYNPNLYFRTGIGIYAYDAPARGVEYFNAKHFEQTYPETDYETMRGDIILFLSQCCNCEEEGV